MSDVRGMVRLLGEVAARDGGRAGKRRLLIAGLARLIDADMWLLLLHQEEAGRAQPISLLLDKGGWESDGQCMKFTEGMVSPAAAPVHIAMSNGAEVHTTVRREEVFPAHRWRDSDLAGKYMTLAGVGDFLCSRYPLAANGYSEWTFLRRLGKPAFAARDACVTHVITAEIEWLHQIGLDASVNDRMNGLSIRQQQVLVQLMAGDSIKQIARKLSLSPHTVNDHLKQIYQRFGVSGRGELMAQLLAQSTRLLSERINLRARKRRVSRVAPPLE